MAVRERAPSKGKTVTLAGREARLAWLLVTPAVLIVLVLVVFPVLWNMLLSLQRVRLRDLQTINFFSLELSLENFERVVGVRDFWDTLRTTIAYAFFGTVLSLVMGVWAALVVKKAFIGRSVVRGLMLFPYVAPVIAVTFLWRIMLNPQFGIVNEWIDDAGMQRVDFLGRRSFELGIFGWEVTLPVALTAVIFFEAWRYFPFAFLFILARLQAMPQDLEEAAMVDGATLSQRFRYV
nr:sugar ABC transporter permease [Acidimicrobiia bacterium]